MTDPLLLPVLAPLPLPPLLVLLPCELEPPLLPELPPDEAPLLPPPFEPDPEPLLAHPSQPELEPEADPPELALPDEPEPLEELPNCPDNPLPGDPELEHAPATVMAASAMKRRPETPQLGCDFIVRAHDMPRFAASPCAPGKKETLRDVAKESHRRGNPARTSFTAVAAIYIASTLIKEPDTMARRSAISRGRGRTG
jgi:hypothetical protein